MYYYYYYYWDAKHLVKAIRWNLRIKLKIKYNFLLLLVVIAPWGEVSVILLPCFLMLCTPCVTKQMSYTFFPLIKFYLIRLSLAHSVQKIQIVSIYILLPPFFHITLLFYLCLYICCSCFFSHLFISHPVFSFNTQSCTKILLPIKIL